MNNMKRHLRYSFKYGKFILTNKYSYRPPTVARFSSLGARFLSGRVSPYKLTTSLPKQH